MDSFQGQLLIAAPRLSDPNFFHTVILLVQHNDEGALGLVLNRPLGASVQQVWKQVSDSVCLIEGTLHQGGPCEGPLMVVYADEGSSSEEGEPATTGLRFSTDRESIEKLVNAGTSDTRFFIGYAGWAAGQLEQELESASWLTVPARPEHVFDDSDDLWQRLHREATRTSQSNWVRPDLIPDDPTLN